MVTVIDRGDGASPIIMPEQADTQLIKRSIAYRAKYRADQGPLPTYRTMVPLTVVPHPRNRGGVPVTSLRTKELVGDIAKDACDVSEANSSAVAVEEQPFAAAARVKRASLHGCGGGGENPEWESFQAVFETRIASDDAMVASGQGMKAILGSLSHSHFNCGCRNILCSKPGCECPSKITRGSGEECTCKACPILDADGNYSLALLQAHDRPWHDLCLTGMAWEVLSWKIDVEEPEAALVISIALNKKNEAAMKTGGLEVWNTLVGLCKPDPSTGVYPYEPIRDKMIELYGSAADSPHFLSMFRLVLDAGGAESPHLVDLKEFTTVHVNPKLRKMRDETYSVLAPYPEKFPRVKNACIKWAWKQPPDRNWCKVPPNIAYRFQADSKTGMLDLMEAVETALATLSKTASTVVERTTKVKWIAEVDITIMSKIFAAPKLPVNGAVAEQTNNLTDEI